MKWPVFRIIYSEPEDKYFISGQFEASQNFNFPKFNFKWNSTHSKILKHSF